MLEEHNWAVYRTGIGNRSLRHYKGRAIVNDNLTRVEAKTYAARMRKLLSSGERHHYKISYRIIQIKED